jgi:hypothetical protein
MFLELPRTRYDEKKDIWVDEPLFINPFHIIAIERDPGDAKCSIVSCVGNYEYYIRHTRHACRKKVEAFLSENVLSKIYKEMKDQQN